jgi:hypothetical protein
MNRYIALPEPSTAHTLLSKRQHALIASQSLSEWIPSGGARNDAWS